MRELSDTDRIFISKLTKIIHTNLENENFGVNELALRSGLNRKVLSRRLKTISGKSVSRFIRETRLNKALELLREGIYTVSEVGYKVGFNSPVYFTRCFHEYFGSTPGEVKKKGADGSDIDIPRVEETHKDLLREKKSYSLKFLVIVLFLAITVFFMLIIFSRLPDTLRLKDSVASDGKIPVVVMPFRNITGDSSLDIWENTIQQGIISSLSLNSRELMIRQQESVNSLLLSEGITRNASISPGIAVKISRKLEASLYIIGNIEKAGEKVRVDAQIIDTSKKEVVRSFNLEQSAKEADFFQITDTLAQRLRNWLLISKLIIEKQDLGRFRFSTNSPEALRYFIYGTDARAKDEYNDAIEWFSKALAIDSNFTDAAFGLENAYAHAGFTDQSKEWLIKNYGKIAGMDPVNQIYASYAYALSFEAPENAIGYLRQLQQMDDHWLKPTYLLGILYNWQGQYYNAIQQFEKLLELCRKWGKEYMQNSSVWEGLGKAYHQTGQFKKAKKIYRKGLRYMPGEPQIIARQALLSFTEKDTVAALHYLGEYEKSIRKNEWSAAKIADGLGDIYAEAGLPDKAEIYYRKALSLEPDNPERFKAIITLFIENNRSLDESQLFIDRAMNLAGNQCRYYEFMDLKGKCLLKQGRVDEALTIIEKAWNEAPFKLYAIRSHLEEVKRAAAMHK